MKSMFAIAGLLAIAGTSMGASLSSTFNPAAGRQTVIDQDLRPDSDRAGISLNVNLGGANSWDALSTASNEVLLIDLGAMLGTPGSAVTMTGIGWNTFLSTVGASWGSEARLYFDDNVAPDLSGLFLRPNSSNAPVTNANDNSGGIIKLAPNGIPDIVLPNGILRLELFESYDDVSGAIDANWLAGSTLTIQVIPAPGATALFGLAGLAAARRRR